MLPRLSSCIPADKDSVVQVKYTNPDVPNGMSIVRFTDMKRAGKYAFDPRIRMTVVPASVHRASKSCFFWIKSSAKRAFGECLGSKRR